MTDHAKVFFTLEQDEDGYPPVSAESVWAVQTGLPFEYTLDNIPFFATQATCGDVIRVRPGDGVLWFDEMVRPSGNSLLRATFFQPTKVRDIREALRSLGCTTEWLEAYHLIAINIPANISLEQIQAFLEEQAEAGVLDYEGAIIRQKCRPKIERSQE